MHAGDFTRFIFVLANLPLINIKELGQDRDFRSPSGEVTNEAFLRFCFDRTGVESRHCLSFQKGPNLTNDVRS